MSNDRASGRWHGRYTGCISSLLAAVLGLCVLLPATASAQQWSQPFDLSEPGAIAQNPWFFIEGVEKPPDVGLDDNGNATFAWLRLDTTGSCGYNGCWQVQAVRRSASGVLGDVRTLSTTGTSARYPQVQVAANGNVVVAWEQDGLVVARMRRASTGLWGPLRNISGKTPIGSFYAGNSFSMALNGQGDVDFAWLVVPSGRFGGRVFVRSWSHSGTLSPKMSVGTGESRSPQVAVFSNGDAIVTWTAQNGETCGAHRCVQLHARPVSPSVLGPTEQVSPPDQRVVRGTPRLAVNASGAALFGWQQLDQPGCPYSLHTYCSRVVVRGRSATGELADRQIASEGSGLLPYDLQLGLDGDGAAVVAWRENKQGLQLAQRSASGDLSPVQTIGTNGRSLELHLASTGGGIFGWLAGDGDTHGCPTWDIGCERMQAMELAPDGSLGPIETLSPGGQDAISSRVALAPNGASAAVWGVGDLGHDQPASEYVQGAFRAAPGSP